ncbi:conserved hypothetical protein [[Clostridium] ultunense Esp]|nr:conserved hypothetical protein [[Clostridium] ultunense Esp]
MNRNSRYITNRLKLREPQAESLELFEKICDQLQLKKEIHLDAEAEKVRELCPTFKNFERDFPSICFSLATGVGKTRLMGAFIAYLYYEKGIKNFFVMAPNLTIYNKLIKDFGDTNNPKYVFRGLDAFITPPRIISGENYEYYRQGDVESRQITINIFNISKLNAETRNGREPRMKRLNEVLGDSYFNYLVELPDLVLLMDESHHYRADRGMAVINELKPVLGIEVTATPQVERGGKSVKFENVVYEYSLAHALKDGKFVKVPAVATRKNFDPEQYSDDELDRIKLIDGVRIHIETQAVLEKYARENNKKIIKPFVLVVAKDTNHSGKLKEYICSDAFYGGYYKDKVLEIHSNQTGAEKDENIERLLSLEEPDNKIEIVIHVNMLKEGWDVTNLYTIIPLRRSASETLTEQTIGRGLRLPYGERTGVDAVDRLNIVHHDKYDAIINAANDPNSIIQKINIIEVDDSAIQDRKTVVEMPSRVSETIDGYSFNEQLKLSLPDHVAPTDARKSEMARTIAQSAYKTVMELNKHVKSFDDIKKPEYRKLMVETVFQRTKELFPTVDMNEEVKQCIKQAVEEVTQIVTDTVIPVPRATIQQVLEIREGYYDFDLDTKNLNYRPADDTIIIKDLKDGKIAVINSDGSIGEQDTPENMIVQEIVTTKSDVDYEKNADLLFKLVRQAKDKFSTYLNPDEVKKVMVTRKRDIADFIYLQMREHFYKDETRFEASEMLPFTKIEVGFGEKYASDELYDFRMFVPAGEIRSKVFKGFKKSCHSLYKFDSSAEKQFAVILEDDIDVLKWMRPAKKQFNIWWDKFSRQQYEPDFVIETADSIYMAEIKMRVEMNSTEVQLKAQAGKKYCDAATEFNHKNGGKSWKYLLIPHDVVKEGTSFDWLAKQFEV